MAQIFNVKFDTRSKQILLNSLNREMRIVEDLIIAGDYSENNLVQYEELSRLIRGILYCLPEEVDTTE